MIGAICGTSSWPTVSFSSADGFTPFSAISEAKTTLYGNVNYETDGDSHGFDGKLGIRVNW